LKKEFFAYEAKLPLEETRYTKYSGPLSFTRGRCAL